MNLDHARSLVVSLEEMLANIEGGQPIADQLADIGRLQGEIASTAPPQLTHFLQNRSYTKALEFLKSGIVSEDPDRPDCDDEEGHPG